MMLSCLDTKSKNVQKWFDKVGKEMTYKQFLIHNYFLPDYDEYSAINKDMLPISKIREVVKDILPNEEFGFKPIDLLEIADPRAEGAFYKDVLYFSSQANLYTAYEEGFHAIYQKLIPTELKENVQKAGKALLEKRAKQEGTTLVKYLSKYPNLEYGIEEEIAKEYINYKLYNSSGFLDRKQNIERLFFLGKLAEPIVKFFEWLSSFFDNVQKNKQKLQSLFDMINSGAFTSTVKMGNTQYEFPSYRIIVLDNNRTLNQKEQANIYSGIKSIYKAIKSTDINQDIETAIEIYKEQVTQDTVIQELLEKEVVNKLTKKAILNNQWKDVFEDIKKQIESSNILSEEEDVESEDAIQAQINGSSDRDSQKSAIERLSAYARDYISNIGAIVKIIEYNEKPIYVKSYIEINNVYSSVVRNLANTSDFYLKLKKLVQLSEDRKSKDTKIFVEQLLQDLFLDKYEGYDVEEYIDKRNADLKEIKDKIKRSNGFEFTKTNSDLVYLSPEATDKLQKILKSFDLYTASVVQQLVDYQNGDVQSYDPHRAAVVTPQLDEWRNNYEKLEHTNIETTTLRTIGYEDLKNSFFDLLGIDVSDGYLKFILGKNGNQNEEAQYFAQEFDHIPEDDIINQQDITFIISQHNNKKDLYVAPEEGEKDESVLTRLRKIARGNAYFDETVLESTYQDAEGKYIYAHQNKTFNLALANIIKSGETWNTDSLKEIKDEQLKEIVKEFHIKTPIQKSIDKGISFNKMGRFRFTGFRQNDKDEKGNKLDRDNPRNTSFKEITPEEFNVAKLNLFVSQTKWIQSNEKKILFTPQFVGHFETANTAEFQYMEYLRPIDEKGNLTETAKNQFLEYIQVEYNRVQDFIQRLVDTNLITLEDGDRTLTLNSKTLMDAGFKSAIDGYYIGTIKYSVANGIVEISKDSTPRALQLSTQLNVFKSLFSTTYNTDKSSKLYDDITEFKSKINELYLKNLDEQISSIKETRGLSKIFTGKYTKLTEPEQTLVNILGFSQNQHYNLKQFITNYELNAIGYDRFVYGDMLVFNKNDMSDLFKRNKGSNAAIVAAYSDFLNEDLGIDRTFKEFKTLTHGEVEGTSSTDGKSVDSMDAQALASIQHTRHLLWGLGRLTPKEASLLTKLHNGEELSEEDKKWMFAQDTFLSANKTVSYSVMQFVKMSEAYTGTLSKRNTAIPVEINITEEEYLSKVTITKDGRIYPKENSTEEITKIGNKYYKWEVAKDRKSLYEKRLVLEGWRKKNNQWVYKGRDYEASLIFPKSASKRMVQNALQLVDNEPDWDNLTEDHFNTIDAGQYGLQVENQGLKDKITDPSQNIEIITNELGDVIISNYVTGEQSKSISAEDFTKTFQNLLAKRDKTSFSQAYKELVTKEGGAIYKYLFELIKAGIDETSSDPQLQQLVQLDPKGNYVYNLNIPLFQQKFQQYLFAYMTKGVLAQKRAGDALVMTSPHGHNLLKKVVLIKDEKGNIIDYSWRVVQRHTQEYKDNVNQAEEGFVNLIYKKGGSWYDKMESLKDKGEFYFIDELRHAVPEYKNGKVIGKFSESLMGKWDEKHSDIQSSFQYMFGVRIPSQDKQSSLNIKLVDWLEDSAGNAIVVPKEYQQLSGADYDVDKIYTYKQEGYWKYDKKTETYNFTHYTKSFKDWKNYQFSSNKTLKKLFKNDKEKIKADLESITNEVTSLIENLEELKLFKIDSKSVIESIKERILDLENFKEEVTSQDIIDFILAGEETFTQLTRSERELLGNLYKEKRSIYSDLNIVKDALKKSYYKIDLLNKKRQDYFDKIQEPILKELQLPLTEEEFLKSDVINNAVVNNELLSMFQSAISSDKMTEKISVKNVAIEDSPYTKEGYELYQDKVNKGIHETGTSVDWLKKADKYYKSLEGIEFEKDTKKYGLRSFVTDFNYFKGTQGGKKGIGSAVNANLASLTWGKVKDYFLGLNLNQEGLENINQYQTITEDGLERTADNISTGITATTDEAKEQALAKYNIRGKALDVFATALALGYRIDQAILLINVPLVQEYLDDRTLASFGKDYKPVSYTEKDLANIKKGTYEDIKEKTLTDVEDAALYDFIQIEKQAEINSNLMKFIRLKRGFSPEYSDFQSIIEAGHKLGFGNLPNMDVVYGKNDLPLYNFAKILEDNKENLNQLYQFVTDIIPDAVKVTEKFLMVANPSYKEILSDLKFNTKSKTDQARLEKEIQTWLISNYLKDTLNTDVLIGENSLAKQLQKTDVKDNALVNHLISIINKDGFDQVAIKAFSRLKTDKQESLIDGFNILMLDEKTKPLAISIYQYFGIKDGFLYKPNSISKVLPINMFNEMSNSVDNFLKDSFNDLERDKIIENILTDISNKNLLITAKENKINGEELIPSTFSIDGKEIPITITTELKSKSGETKKVSINVEYIVNTENSLPNFIRVGANLYKKYRIVNSDGFISEDQVKYVLVPFYGNSKFKIQTTKEKIIAPQDVELTKALVQGFKNDKGENKEARYKSLGRKDYIYNDLIKEYSQALSRTQVVDNTYVDEVEDTEEEEVKQKVTDVSTTPTVAQEISEIKDSVQSKKIENKEVNQNFVALNEKNEFDEWITTYDFLEWASYDKLIKFKENYNFSNEKLINKLLLQYMLLSGSIIQKTGANMMIMDIATKQENELMSIFKEAKLKTENEKKIYQLRKKEKEELQKIIPDIEKYEEDEIINRKRIPKKYLEQYDEIYSKYNKLITPLLKSFDIYQAGEGDSYTSTKNKLVAHQFITEDNTILDLPSVRTAVKEIHQEAKDLLGIDVTLFKEKDNKLLFNKEQFKAIDEFNKVDKINNKEGIDFVFEQNPELKSIGSKEQYSNYISTIFPESKVKDIVYHGSDKKFENFDNSFKGKTTGLNSYTDGTKIDSTFAFFFTDNINTTFQYSYLNRIEKLKSLEYLFEAFINKDQITYNKLKDLHPEVRTLLMQKKQELTPENFEQFIKNLFISYKNINSDIGGAGFLNQIVNYNVLKNNINYLKNNKNIILNLKKDLPFNLISYGEKADYFDINKEGVISSSNLNYNKKNIKNFTDLEYNNLIIFLENRYKNSFFKVENLIKKAKFTPTTYSVVLNLKDYKEKDFQGATFVDQFTEQGANYEASKLTEQAYNEKQDGVVFKNIKDPVLSTNYGVFDPKNIHILGNKQDQEMFAKFVNKETTELPINEEYITSPTDGLYDFTCLI